jgi:S1-C subfamily serine protease
VKALVLALALGLASCAPRTLVVRAPADTDVAVATGLRHTVFADKLGCSAIDVGRGIVVTAKHCVDHLELGGETEAGMVIYMSPDLDFALLFDAGRLQNPRPAIRAPRLGEHIYAIGYPVQLATKEQELTVTDGIVCGPGDGEGHLRITAPIYYGNSGGGLWAEDGAFVGVTVSGFLEMPGMNFVVSAADVEPWIP